MKKEERWKFERKLTLFTVSNVMEFFKFNPCSKINLAVLIKLFYKCVNKLQEIKLSKLIHRNDDIGYSI